MSYGHYNNNKIIKDIIVESKTKTYIYNKTLPAMEVINLVQISMLWL